MSEAAEEKEFTGKVVLVTGGSRGIGRAVAQAFAQGGASVAIAARHADELERTAAAIREHGVPCLPLVCDVTNAEQVGRLPSAMSKELGPVDILVNNAGAADSHKFLDHPDELWQRMLEVNLTGTYRVCKAIVPGMIERQRGRIINIASIAAKVGAPYLVAYTAAKHGVLGLTRALAAELNRYNITVNAVCPGYVNTPMTDAAVARIVERTGRSESEARQLLADTSPQKRLIEPEEVAAVTLWLASESARGITGQAVNVDGGAVMF